MEFATPRIHNPIYEFAGGCFTGSDGGLYSYDPRSNQPLHAASPNTLKPILLLIAVAAALLVSTTGLEANLV